MVNLGKTFIEILVNVCYNIGKMYVEEISLNMYLKIINKDGGKTNENL